MEGTNFSLEVVLVLEDGVKVRVHADAVGKHLFLMVEERVSAEVVSKVNLLVHGGARGIPSLRRSTRSIRSASHRCDAELEEEEGFF